MEPQVLAAICNQISKQYPGIKGHNPGVTKQANGQYLIIFSMDVETPDGKVITHKIRVIASDEGKILKTSMSR